MFCLIVPLLNFNPRSHEGSDIDEAQLLFNSRISIHAPTRGATQTDRIRDRQSYNFNPRSHEGSDILRHTFATRCIISIHAPTRGATIIGRCCHKYRRFQSTLPRGERRICTRERNQSIRFQSTLPRGERQQTTRRFP